MPHRFGLPAVVPVFLALVLSADVAAQAVVVGDVVDRGTAEPLGGVFVVVLNDGGRQVAGVLTDEAGRFRVRVPAPGRYTLRAARIGFDPVDSPPLELGASAITFRFELESRPIELAGVVVEAEDRQCRVRPQEGDRLQAVWEQVRIALDVTAWAERTGYVRAQQRTYERWLYPESGQVREERVQGRRTFGHAGFVAAPPEELVSQGFIREDGDEFVYYGLDASTLVSDPFLDTHCFHLRAPRRGEDGLIGLAFEPMRGRRVTGVRGVLWLDEVTAELRTLEYSYTRLPWQIPLEPYGGETEFRRLPGGAWIVERWAIRMPELERATSRLARRRGSERVPGMPASVRLMIKEDGGEVVAIFTADGVRLPGARRAALEGLVHDSIGGGPLAGARVLLEGTGFDATTDETGRYRLDDLPDGRYVLAFEHPLLEAWAIVPGAAEVTLRRGEVTVQDLAVPSLATVLGLGCSEAGGGVEGAVAAGAGAVVGRVVSGGTGEPVGGAVVTLRLDGQAPEDAMQVWTDASGVYRFCDAGDAGAGPAADDDPAASARRPGLLKAEFMGRPSPEVEVEVPAAGPVFRELTLGLDAPSQVVGRVVDAETGQPVPGVTVRLAGLPDARVSGHDGRFVFPAVGPGDHALEARHLAYHTVEDRLRVDGMGRTLQLEVRVAEGAIPLDPILVTVDSRPMSGLLRAVYDRMDRVRLTGGGTVFDRQDIERRNPRQVVHLLSEVRGVQAGTYGRVPVILSTRSFSGWGNCLMTVWVDGVMVLRGGTAGMEEEVPNINDVISVSNIEAIEVYHASGRIPEEYWGSASGCGVVLIWSRRET